MTPVFLMAGACAAHGYKIAVGRPSSHMTGAAAGTLAGLLP
jgi:hypothetical protein